MKRTINVHDFRNDFRSMRPDNFSYEGLEVLFNHLEEMEDSCDIEIEFDVIAICCDYSEANADEIAQDYGLEDSDHDSVVEYLNDNTMVAGVTSDMNIVYCAF